MPSETDCLNDALGQIGAARITAIDDGSINANHCQTFYPPLRDSLLRGFKWNFNLTRATLAQDATPPEFEYNYSYTLPSDCLRVWEYVGTHQTASVMVPAPGLYAPTFKIEGRHLLSNHAEAAILYGARITNPDLWDALFYQVVCTWLASKLASAITKDEKKAQLKLQEASEVLLPLALAADGQEGSVEPQIVDDLIWGRFSA